jgi:hypothetical protein
LVEPNLKSLPFLSSEFATQVTLTKGNNGIKALPLNPLGYSRCHLPFFSQFLNHFLTIYPGTGWVSTRFSADLLLSRLSASVHHKITALGISSESKGTPFISSIFPSDFPKQKVYTDYNAVYTDPEVDIIYIGTPHALHKEQCLSAISVGKQVLCEKPFMINAHETLEVIAPAKEKGVYIIEGSFPPLTSHFPVH